MKKLLAAFLLPLFIFNIFGCAKNTDAADVSPTPSDESFDVYNECAVEFVTAMANGDFNAAVAMLDDTMKALVSASALQTDVWDAVIGQAGAFIAVDGIENAVADGYYICFTTSRHENSGVTLRIVFSKDCLIAGLFVDAYPELEKSEAETVQRDGFTDYPVIIGEGTDYPLDGILSIPDGVENPPAVVLVHGSGPSDMDETIFSNKPFRDIAEYLAANGVAVLRYDKRTFTHGVKLMQALGSSITVKEEVVDDAILAAQLLKSDPRIDASRVFILGHSLGGMLAPRIHSEGGDFAGLILFAGSPRSLLDISYDQQVAFIDAMPEGDEKTAALAQIETYDEQIAALMALSDEEAKNTPMSGTAFYYFKELDEHPSTDYLQTIDKPIFVLQGSADFQVLADKDFALYNELLGSRANVTLKLYDGLNHLFMPSVGADIANYQEEYMVSGHVDDTVLQDLAAWINSN